MATAARASASASASRDREAHALRRAAPPRSPSTGPPSASPANTIFSALPPTRLAQDRRPAGREVALVDVELVGIDGALHHRLAQAIGRGDEHHLVEAGLGVEREHDAGGAQVAAHHALHARRQRDVGVREALVDAIGDRAVVVERREYLSYRLKYIIYTIDIKKCFLLTGERGIGQVFGGRRRAHGKRRVRRADRVSAAYAAPMASASAGCSGASRDPAADLAPGLGQRVERRSTSSAAQAIARSGASRSLLAEEVAKGRGRRGEAARHPDAGAGELADHLAQRRVLAADLARRRSCASGRTG